MRGRRSRKEVIALINSSVTGGATQASLSTTGRGLRLQLLPIPSTTGNSSSSLFGSYSTGYRAGRNSTSSTSSPTLTGCSTPMAHGRCSSPLSTTTLGRPTSASSCGSTLPGCSPSESIGLALMLSATLTITTMRMHASFPQSFTFSASSITTTCLMTRDSWLTPLKSRTSSSRIL